MDCATIAKGIIAACKEITLSVPIVVRLEGKETLNTFIMNLSPLPSFSFPSSISQFLPSYPTNCTLPLTLSPLPSPPLCLPFTPPPSLLPSSSLPPSSPPPLPPRSQCGQCQATPCRQWSSNNISYRFGRCGTEGSRVHWLVTQKKQQQQLLHVTQCPQVYVLFSISYHWYK